MTEQNQVKYSYTKKSVKRELLKSIWLQTKSTSLVRECEDIFDGEKHALL